MNNTTQPAGWDINAQQEWWNIEGRTPEGDYTEEDIFGTRAEAIAEFQAGGDTAVKIRPSHPNTIERREAARERVKLAADRLTISLCQGDEVIGQVTVLHEDRTNPLKETGAEWWFDAEGHPDNRLTGYAGRDGEEREAWLSRLIAGMTAGHRLESLAAFQSVYYLKAQM